MNNLWCTSRCTNTILHTCDVADVLRFSPPTLILDPVLDDLLLDRIVACDWLIMADGVGDAALLGCDWWDGAKLVAFGFPSAWPSVVSIHNKTLKMISNT